MILRLAFRNIVGNGYRSLINVLILAIVLIIMVWMQAMYHSWTRLALIQQTDWEYGKGLLRSKLYDPYDSYTWEDSAVREPEQLKSAIQGGDLVPILISPASIYPKGRMMPAVLRGIPHDQDVLRLPVSGLKAQGKDIIPVLIGQNMAQSSRLEKGDIFSIRIKDSSGVFNALDAEVSDVIHIPAASADMSSVWLDLEALREVKASESLVTYFVMGDARYADHEYENFRHIPKSEYFADFYEMLATERVQQVITYALLIFLAMIAVFDTQALAVFKRRKEIGTLASLGLTKGKISLLFTLEGIYYLLFAAIAGAILGFPLFWYFAQYGFQIPKGYEDFGIQGFTEPIYFVYPMGEIIGLYLLVLCFTALFSWLPTRKITKLSPVDALRGKVD